MLQLTTILFLISLSVLAVLHYISLKLFLYWQLPWLDVPMHLFGGAVVALGLFTVRDLRLMSVAGVKFGAVLLFVFLVALGWEGFELWAGIPIEDDYYLDTVLDLSMGLIGGYIGYFVGTKLRSL